MITKNKSWLFAALFMLFGLFSAQAQSVVHNKAYYDAITYQWTDASGASHESCVTEEATDPYQIVALLKKVYCDPRLPGPKYSAFKQNGEPEDPVYYGAVDGGWNISASEVTEPYEEGYTVLMVALNNTITPIGSDTEQLVNVIDHWLIPDEYVYETFNSNFFTTANELIDYVRRNITSVLLLTDGIRMGSGEKAGTAFNVSGEYNRFFLLGKGQARKKDQPVIDRENQSSTYPVIAGEYVPFKKMFEQFSPTDGSENSQITDFYSKMVAGDVYPVIHDCNSVIEKQHEFSMSGKTGTEYKSLTGLNIFIPDYRLKYWVNDHYYLHYQNGDSVGPFVVDGRTMNPWKNIYGNQMYSGYNPYTANKPSWLCAPYAQYDPNNSPRVGLYTIKLDADAAEADAEYTYDVVLDWTSSLNTLAGEEVPQTYTVYIVDEYGYNTELTVTNDTHYTYPVPQEEHSYTLTYVVYGVPSDGEHDMFVAWSNTDDVVIPGWNDFLVLDIDHYESDYVINAERNYYRNFFALENLDELNALTTARVQAGENQFILYRFDMANPDNKIEVATVNLTVTGNGVRYTVQYDEQDMRPNYNIDVTLQGMLGVDNGVIDFDGLTLVDQFSADVSENMHAERYGYILSLGEIGDDVKTTNTVEIPVIKNYGFNLGYYTEQQILEDTEAELTPGVKNADIEYELYNTQEVYYVDLLRGNEAAPSQVISHLQRRTDGSFFEFSDALPEYTGAIEYYWVDRYDTNVVTGEYDNFMTYVPVTKTFGEDRVKHDGENSYGGEIYKNYVAGLDVEVDGTVSDHGTYANWYDENGEECAIFNPVITIDAKLSDKGTWEYRPVMYRVWLKCDNLRGYEVDPNNGHSVNVEGEYENFYLLVEDNVDGDTHVVYGDALNDELAFGATFASRNGGISFLVRMYYEVEAMIPLKSNYPSWMPVYYVVEKEIPWNNVPTAVREINSDNVVAKTYYNAQGLSSDKPFDGVNIVVTKYGDGTTKTNKVIF